MMLPVNLGHQKQAQLRLPQIIWTDLVFRVPPHKPRVEVATKAKGRCSRPLQAAATLHAGRGGSRPAPKGEKSSPCHLRLDCIQEKEAEEGRRECPPSRSPASGNPPSTPQRPAPREKRAVRKILVDLRPILEKVRAASDSRQEERAARGPQPDRRPSSDAGDFGPEDLHAGGRDLPTQVTTTCPQEGGTHPGISLPPLVDPCKASSFAARSSSPRTGFQTQSGDTPQPWKHHLQESPAPEPRFRTTVSFPKIIPQQQQDDWLETICSGETPAAPSPDFQLPTRLLLQRLQETTTSRNHVLIMEVLSTLREELIVSSPPLDIRDKKSRLLELPRSNPWKKPKSNSRPAAAKPRRGKLTWHINRSVCTALGSPHVA